MSTPEIPGVHEFFALAPVGATLRIRALGREIVLEVERADRRGAAYLRPADARALAADLLRERGWAEHTTYGTDRDGIRLSGSMLHVRVDGVQSDGVILLPTEMTTMRAARLLDRLARELA